jgi:uncharacterized protein (TIGR02271 family)
MSAGRTSAGHPAFPTGSASGEPGHDSGSPSKVLIPVVEETLEVRKREVDTGGVRIVKTIETHRQLVDEALQRDEVRVERRSVDRPVTEGVEPQPYWQGDTLVVPIVEEVLVVSRQLRVTEELLVHRRRTEYRAPQRVGLRREQVRVEHIEPNRTIHQQETNMTTALVGVFENREQATKAYNELLSEGFLASDVMLRAGGSSASEAGAGTGAGASTGTGTVGTTATAGRDTRDDGEVSGTIGDWFRSLFGLNDDDDDLYVYDEAMRRGHYLLTVSSVSEDRVDRVSDIMERCGSIDIEERATQWQQQGWTRGGQTAGAATTGAAMASAAMTGSGLTSASGSGAGQTGLGTSGAGTTPGARMTGTGTTGSTSGAAATTGSAGGATTGNATGANYGGMAGGSGAAGRTGATGTSGTTGGASALSGATGTVTGVGTGSSGAAGTGATSRETGETSRIPVVEEELRVGKRRVGRGGVRVYTRVVERPVEETVRLREERATVERRPADRPATEADFRALEKGSVEVRTSAEEAVVSKQARVTEEIEVGKEVRERSETVRDTVRHTEVQVERNDDPVRPGAGSGTTGTAGTTGTTGTTGTRGTTGTTGTTGTPGTTGTGGTPGGAGGTTGTGKTR